MKDLPRLELTEDPNKNNDFIIFRNNSKTKYVTKKRSIKRRNVKKRKTRKTGKGLFNLF